MLIDLASDIDRVSVIVRDLKKMNKSALMSDCMRRGLIQVETELQNVGQLKSQLVSLPSWLRRHRTCGPVAELHKLRRSPLHFQRTL